MTLSRFTAVAGRVTGREHRRAHRDGQDGLAIVSSPTVCAAIVTDGCSSGRASEVGARLGAAWLADLVARELPATEPALAPERVTSLLVERLDATARSLGGGAILPEIVGDFLLFGYLVAAVTETHAVVFGVGDGVAWIDGRTERIDPGPENAPAYAAYALLGAEIRPHVLHVGPAGDLDLVAVATDGAEALLSSEPSLDVVVRDARYVRNPSLLRKQLIVLGDRLWDDTTIGIVRRVA